MCGGWALKHKTQHPPPKKVECLRAFPRNHLYSLRHHHIRNTPSSPLIRPPPSPHPSPTPLDSARLGSNQSATRHAPRHEITSLLGSTVSVANSLPSSLMPRSPSSVVSRPEGRGRSRRKPRLERSKSKSRMWLPLDGTVEMKDLCNKGSTVNLEGL